MLGEEISGPDHPAAGLESAGSFENLLARCIEAFVPVSFRFQPIVDLHFVSVSPLRFECFDQFDPVAAEESADAVPLIVWQAVFEGFECEVAVGFSVVFEGHGFVEALVVYGFDGEGESEFSLVDEIAPIRPEVCIGGADGGRAVGVVAKILSGPEPLIDHRAAFSGAIFEASMNVFG